MCLPAAPAAPHGLLPEDSSALLVDSVWWPLMAACSPPSAPAHSYHHPHLPAVPAAPRRLLPEDNPHPLASGFGAYGGWAASGELDVLEMANDMREVGCGVGMAAVPRAAQAQQLLGPGQLTPDQNGCRQNMLLARSLSLLADRATTACALPWAFLV